MTYKAGKIMIRNRSHLEIRFKVWQNHHQCWLWLVVDPHSDAGTVGAAPTEAEAISEARSSIENQSA